jgi:hypothetical protein
LIDKMASIQSLDDIRNRRHGEAVVRRLEWIENRLYWTGLLRRRDVCAQFEISPQQASVDIAAYAQLRPGNLVFEGDTKSYVRGAAFRPLFPKNPGAWLAAEKGILSPISFERATSPWRPADDAVVTSLIAASERKTPLSVLYLSLRRRAPIRRTICPHTIVDADGRLHVRAFDYERRRFSDFLVTRMHEMRSDESVAWVDKAADSDWHEIVELRIAPNPEISKEQARAAMKDLGLPETGGNIKTRRALAFYLVRTLRPANLTVPDAGNRYVCTNRDDAVRWIQNDVQSEEGDA